MNPYETAFHLLDYSRCEFAYMDSMLRVVQQYVKFENCKQLEEAFEQNMKDAIAIGYPNHRPLVISNIAFTANCDVDLFAVKGCTYRYNGLFVSEKLRNHIQSESCTGMIFKALNESPY